VESLKGVQPLAPRLPYGQSTIRIEAIQSTSEVKETYCIGQELWIGLKKFHVLEPAGLKILIYIDQSFKDTSSAGFGLPLARKTKGPANLLSVVASPDQLSDVLIRLQDIRQQWISGLNEINTNVRQGNFTEEILREAQEGQYEIVIFNWNDRNVNYISKAMQLLTSLKFPVLLCKDQRPDISRILICTKAGEPGKDDIRFGARVAKLTKSYTTLFHVLRKNSSMQDKSRAENHLQSGKATLTALDIQTEIKIEEENSPVKGILNEFKKNEYDLLIIGAPAPKSSYNLFWTDLTNQIINVTPVPVLIVPMAEK
jgi:nucleotide-binding universal stress UspA family protein